MLLQVLKPELHLPLRGGPACCILLCRQRRLVQHTATEAAAPASIEAPLDPIEVPAHLKDLLRLLDKLKAVDSAMQSLSAEDLRRAWRLVCKWLIAS